MLAGLLGVNALRMWWFTIGRESLGRDKKLKVSLGSYISKVWLLPTHFFTQKRYGKCEHKKPWLTHLALMLSYVTMLVLIMGLLLSLAFVRALFFLLFLRFFLLLRLLLYDASEVSSKPFGFLANKLVPVCLRKGIFSF